MGDHDNLRFGPDYLEQLVEPENIGVVQGRVDFVHQAERGRLEHENGKDKGDGGKGFFAARQQAHAGQLFTGWLDHKFHAGLERIARFGQGEFSGAALEQPWKDFADFLIDRVERRHKFFLGNPVDLPDNPVQVINRLEQVIPLLSEKILTIFQLIVFADGAQVDIGDARNSFATSLQFGFHLFDRLRRRLFRRRFSRVFLVGELTPEIGQGFVVTLDQTVFQVFTLQALLGKIEFDQANFLVGGFPFTRQSRGLAVVFAQLFINSAKILLIALQGRSEFLHLFVEAFEGRLAFIDTVFGFGHFPGFAVYFGLQLRFAGQAIRLEFIQAPQGGFAVFQTGFGGGQFHLKINNVPVEAFHLRFKGVYLAAGGRHGFPGGCDAHADFFNGRIGPVHFGGCIIRLTQDLFLFQLDHFQVAAGVFQVFSHFIQSFFSLDFILNLLPALLNEFLQFYFRLPHGGRDFFLRGVARHQFLFQGFDVIGQGFDLRFLGQDAGQFVPAAANQNTTGGDQVALQGNHGPLIGGLGAQVPRRRKIGRHQDPAQQFLGKFFITGTCGDMLYEQIFARVGRGRPLGAVEVRHRDETAASGCRGPQILHCVYAGLHILDQHVLQGFT